MPEEQIAPSIIEIIQKMVADGESEEKILQTLKDLGVEEKKAKKLLLVGEADTFALLKNEINKIASEQIENEKPKLVKFLESEAKKAGDQTRQEVADAVLKDLEQYEKDITGQSQTFQSQINDNVKRVTDLSHRVREKLNELGTVVGTMQVDVEEFKLKGIATRNRYISLLLLVLGILFCIVDLYLFLTRFDMGMTIDSIIITIIIGLLGITMLFVATLL